MKYFIYILLVLLLSSTQQEILGQNGWFQVYSNNNHPPMAFSFLNTQTGFITGGWGLFAKTNNGGYSWQTSYLDTLADLRGIFFFDDMNGLISSSEGKIYKTTNGGLSWNIYSVISYYGLLDLYFVNTNIGYAAATGGAVFNTTNGGLNWAQQTISINSLYFWDIHFSTPSFGYIVGESDEIYRTTNAGTNWYLVNSDSLGRALYYIDFPSINIGYVVGDLGTIWKTTNSGSNWYKLVPFTNHLFKGVSFINETTGFVTGNGFSAGIIANTTNGGLNWNVENVNSGLSRIKFLNNSTGYLISSGIKILKTTNGGGTIGIQPTSTEIPNQFSLSQNYPNPFNPNTKIEFRISNSGFASLTVFDVLGREVQTLVNEQLKPGIYELDFDGTNYPSGVYYYKLSAGSFVDSKKMILIK